MRSTNLLGESRLVAHVEDAANGAAISDRKRVPARRACVQRRVERLV
jgi:hypothetical protein